MGETGAAADAVEKETGGGRESDSDAGECYLRRAATTRSTSRVELPLVHGVTSTV